MLGWARGTTEAGEGAYFTTLLDYVHLNPVRAGLLKTGADGQAADLSAYRWSSWPEYLQPQRRPAWLTTSRAFAMWGEEDSARGRKAVQRRVQARIAQESTEACGLSEIDGQGPVALRDIDPGEALQRADFSIEEQTLDPHLARLGIAQSAQ